MSRAEQDKVHNNRSLAGSSVEIKENITGKGIMLRAEEYKDHNEQTLDLILKHPISRFLVLI